MNLDVAGVGKVWSPISECLLRRGHARLIATLLLSIGATSLAEAKAHRAALPTVVLVHGAFEDALVWSRTKVILERRGFRVVAVNLPGRPGGADMPVSLDSYRDTVLGTVRAQPGRVVLVGHSFGGITISNVAEAVPEKIATLVYLAAYLPRDGEALTNLAQRDAGSKTGDAFVVDGRRGVATIAVNARARLFCNDCPPSIAAAIPATMVPEPLGPLSTPVRLSAARFGSVDKVYIRTKRDQVESPQLQTAMLAATPVRRELTLDTGHAPFLSNPQALATAIVDIMRPSPIVDAKSVASPRAPLVETLASFPHGTFLENLSVATDGTIYFTSYFAKSIMMIRPGSAAATFVQLPAHPVGIIKTVDGFIVTAHALPFNDAPAFLASNQLLVLANDGTVRKTVRAPDARFLNGLVEVSADKVLIADSIAGLIWALTPSTGAIRPWLRDATLAVRAGASDQRPAANGLKLHRGNLYVSNSSLGAIYHVKMTGDGEANGVPVRFVAPGPVDDFAFAADGSIYAATHGSKLLRISSDASVSDVMSSGCDSCTSVAVTGDRQRPKLIVLTTGNLLEGGAAAARVLRVTPAKQ